MITHLPLCALEVCSRCTDMQELCTDFQARDENEVHAPGVIYASMHVSACIQIASGQEHAACA